MTKAYIAAERGVLWSFTEINPAKLNRSRRNLTGKRGLRWDARLENFGALCPTAAPWRRKNENFFVRTTTRRLVHFPGADFPEI